MAIALDRPAQGPRASVPRFFFDARGRGIPRMEDLTVVRALERTHTVSLPVDTILGQVTTTPWVIRPTVEKPTKAHKAAAAEVTEWLDGRFNQNRESFDHLCKAWLSDVLSIDAGVLELVPDRSRHLVEVYARDGATFTKVIDEHDRLPPPGTTETAYWQHGHRMAATRAFDPETPLRDIAQEMNGLAYATWADPVPFTRDELVWTEENPKTSSRYGFGRVQKIARLVEIVLNQDLTNIRSFRTNDVPPGLLAFPELGQAEAERFREWWKAEVRGKVDQILPMVGSKAEYIPFRAVLRDLQFLESQSWYNKLVWMTFGLNQNEVGDVADVNRATAREQATTVYRRTTRPMLDLLAAEINRDILPFVEAYARVNGELEFAWLPQNPDVEAWEREKQERDLEVGTAIPNEVRLARGLEPLPWGNLPLELVRTVARAYPEWALQHWGGVPKDDLPARGLGGFGFLSARPRRTAPAPVAKDLDALEDVDGLPPVVARVWRLRRAVAKVLQEVEDDVAAAVEAAWPPDEAGKATGRRKAAIDISAILSRVSAADALTTVVVAEALDALDAGAEYEANRLLRLLRERVGDAAADVEFAFNVQDSAQARILAEEAAVHMRHVEETVKEEVRAVLVDVVDAGGNVGAAKRALAEKFDFLTTAHADLIARTEILGASRRGAQALAESTDLIDRKTWRSAKAPGRTRPWHAAMDGVTVGKNDAWTVPSGWEGPPHHQPSDYPKTVRIVGEDQPYNCMCWHEDVLRDDLPTDARSLARVRGLRVRAGAPGPLIRTAPGPRAREVLAAHGAPGEDFRGMLRRLAAAHSRNELARVLGVSKTTLYAWLDQDRGDRGI